MPRSNPSPDFGSRGRLALCVDRPGELVRLDLVLRHAPFPLPPTSENAVDLIATVDTERAEVLLHAVAVELSRHRHGGRVGALHLRALALKRDVLRWKEHPPTDARRRAVLDEIHALHDSVKAARHGHH